MKKESIIIDTCPDCGQEIWVGNDEYVTSYPTSSDIARERAELEHLFHCPSVDHWGQWRKKARAEQGETPLALLHRLRNHGAGLEELLHIPVPPDRWYIANDGGADHHWPEEVEQWWENIGGPLVGAEYARAVQNGWV